MSPEVVAGSFAVAASDLWSFGVMLFMMVSGGLSPFWAGNDYKTEARVLGGLQHISWLLRCQEEIFAVIFTMSGDGAN